MKKLLLLQFAFLSFILAAIAIVMILVRVQNNNQDDQESLNHANVPGITPMPLPTKTFHQTPRDYNRLCRRVLFEDHTWQRRRRKRRFFTVQPVDGTRNPVRPFLFLIRERKTGTILFLGRVMNPNER